MSNINYTSPASLLVTVTNKTSSSTIVLSYVNEDQANRVYEILRKHNGTAEGLIHYRVVKLYGVIPGN